LRFDPDALTLGDLEDFETFVGNTIDEVIKPVPVTDDNDDPGFTIDDARRVKVSALSMSAPVEGDRGNE
jgi:hypothetical protein